jgi:hypothetical protein
MSIGMQPSQVDPEPTRFGAHDSTLRDFQRREDIFNLGLRSDTNEIWRLPDGEAKIHREFVKKNVLCPVPGCPNPALTTVRRVRGRDGLRHLSDAVGGHAPESLFHSQGCARIEEWLAAKYPNSRVQREEYSNAAGERRADVMITSLLDSTMKVAFEIQYSPITPDEWQERHDSYARQRIQDVWLFGHTKKHFRPGENGALSLTPAHEAVLASGSKLLFFNPDEDLIASATGFVTDVATGQVHQSFRNLTSLRPQFQSLTHFSVSRFGISSEHMRGIAEVDGAIAAKNLEWEGRIDSEWAEFKLAVRAESRVESAKGRTLQAQVIKAAPWQIAPALCSEALGFAAANGLSLPLNRRALHASSAQYRYDFGFKGLQSHQELVLYLTFIFGYRKKLFTIPECHERLKKTFGPSADPKSAYREIREWLLEAGSRRIVEQKRVGKFFKFRATEHGANGMRGTARYSLPMCSVDAPESEYSRYVERAADEGFAKELDAAEQSSRGDNPYNYLRQRHGRLSFC